MSLIVRWSAVCAFVLVAGAASAIQIEYVEVGDVYYLDRNLNGNVLVVVLGVDASSRLVKVRFKNGAVDWVHPGRLLSQSQYDAQSAEVDLLALRLLGCLFDSSICAETPWRPGSRHARNPHVIASHERNKWVPAPGYEWDGPQTTVLTVRWAPGQRHPTYAHVIAGPEVGTWLPENGYMWAQPGTFGPVAWMPGTAHRESVYIVAGPTPGKWKPIPGYVWRNPARPGDYSVVRK